MKNQRNPEFHNHPSKGENKHIFQPFPLSTAAMASCLYPAHRRSRLLGMKGENRDSPPCDPPSRKESSLQRELLHIFPLPVLVPVLGERVRVRVRGFPPLIPALSPEYGGEGGICLPWNDTSRLLFMPKISPVMAVRNSCLLLPFPLQHFLMNLQQSPLQGWAANYINSCRHSQT